MPARTCAFCSTVPLKCCIICGAALCSAELAIAETTGEQEPTNPADWAEEAQVWLACRMEFEGGQQQAATACHPRNRAGMQRQL